MSNPCDGVGTVQSCLQLLTWLSNSETVQGGQLALQASKLALRTH